MAKQKHAMTGTKVLATKATLTYVGAILIDSERRVMLTLTMPTKSGESQTVNAAISEDEAKDLHKALGLLLARMGDPARN